MALFRGKETAAHARRSGFYASHRVLRCSPVSLSWSHYPAHPAEEATVTVRGGLGWVAPESQLFLHYVVTESGSVTSPWPHPESKLGWPEGRPLRSPPPASDAGHGNPMLPWRGGRCRCAGRDLTQLGAGDTRHPRTQGLKTMGHPPSPRGAQTLISAAQTTLMDNLPDYRFDRPTRGHRRALEYAHPECRKGGSMLKRTLLAAALLSSTISAQSAFRTYASGCGPGPLQISSARGALPVVGRTTLVDVRGIPNNATAGVLALDCRTSCSWGSPCRFRST